ncbi:phage tail assembly chaperone [Achromobacter marplatensis]|uniref:phage tail assembly chaperone n=1 Tax=Achromobacter marplatensis TaxID=470868 RepID=UPI0028EA405C|nr:phage tail assembly chaperone [Achromobacter marplatensis]
MAFVTTKRAVAACPIKVVVHGETGEAVTIEFVAQYKRHTLEQVADLQDSMANAYNERMGRPPIERKKSVPKWTYTSDVEFIKDKMTGWLGARDHQAEAIPFNAKTLAQVLSDWPEVVAPLFNGFFEAHQQVREKNS